MSEDPPKPLTITQLRVILEQLEAQGAGNHPLMVPYDPGHATIGSRAMLPLVGVHQGFDWEQGKVILQLSQTVSAQDKSLHSRLQRQANALMRVGLAAARLGEDTLFPLEKQVEVFKTNIKFMVDKGLSDPAKDKPRPSTKP